LSPATGAFSPATRLHFARARSGDLLEQPFMSTILIIILIIILIGAIPSWPYSRNWGYAPSGLLGVVVVVLLILALMGRI
jgi:hypothetical protein